MLHTELSAARKVTKAAKGASELPDARAHLWSRKDAARYLRISRATFWRRSLEQGFPKPVKITPGLSHYVADDLRRWLDQRITEARDIAQMKSPPASE